MDLPQSMIRFGSFTLDTKSGELRKSGSRVRLAPQPSRLLILLATRPGEIVAREEICKHIWNDETFVDFEKGLNFCVKQIRTALKDNAERPKYIETLPRRGYRFIATLESDSRAVTELQPIENSLHSIDSAPVKVPSFWRRSYRLWFSVALVLLVLPLTASGPSSKARPLKFPNRGWVVVAAFENRTGESILDDTIEYALKQDLSESHFINVLAPERIDDALWQMKKPKNTRLEPDVAREVALRDGETSLVLTGRVEKLGHTYLVSTSLMEPATGAVMGGLSEQASDQDALVPAMRRLAWRLREKLGDTALLPQQSDGPLEKATTASLRALQFYSRGIAFINQNEWSSGTEMFNRAIQEDSDFATAHIYLAHCYANAGKDREAAPHFQRAFDLADRTTDRERYFILGSYFDRFKNDWGRAIEAYTLLVQLYPDDFWGTNNLHMILMVEGRPREALPYIVRMADLRPNSLEYNVDALDALSRYGSDPQQTQVYLERAQRIGAARDASLRWPDQWTQLQFIPEDQYVRDGDLTRALQELDELALKVDLALGDSRALFLEELGSRYFALGRLHAAEQYFLQLPEEKRHLELSILAGMRGDKAALRKELLALIASPGDNFGPGTALRLAREGLITQSAKLLSSPVMANRSALGVQAAKGELAMAEGNFSVGLRELRGAWEGLRRDRDQSGWSLLAAQALADALRKAGKTADAVQVLEQEVQENEDLTALDGISLNLAQLYRELGRDQDAKRLEIQVVRHLAVADADHPILAQM